MKNLLAKNKYHLLLLLLLTHCTTTSSYKVFNSTEDQTEILVTPDRVQIQCESLQEPGGPPDEYERYGFMIHVLDDADTVLTISQSRILDKEGCFNRFNKITKILQGAKQIYIGGSGRINEPRTKKKWQHSFNGKGPYFVNGRSFDFSIVKGNQGTCFTSNDNDDCKAYGFPINKFPF